VGGVRNARAGECGVKLIGVGVAFGAVIYGSLEH